MSDIKKQAQFIEMRATGMSFAKISEQLGVSKPTLISWSKDFELDIQNLRTIEQEALREKYLITKEKRIEMLGDSLDKVKQELAKRDLSEVPTEKLFALNIKLLQEIKAEEVSALPFSQKGAFVMDLSELQEWSA
ncbi:MAG TPA: helix-turn-helix domain-containing protein [Patescibacteria group bacterium]